MSARHDKPFVEINCAAIPSELLESELFGHEKGAFTDARAQKLGPDGAGQRRHAVPRRDRRDEPRCCRSSCCACSSAARSSASAAPRTSRSTCASSRPPTRTSSAWCEEGAFREDLYYRLKVVPLFVPPLRERREDILPLSRLFMDRFARQFKKPFQRHLAGRRARAHRVSVAGQHPRAAQPVRAHGAAREPGDARSRSI